MDNLESALNKTTAEQAGVIAPGSIDPNTSAGRMTIEVGKQYRRAGTHAWGGQQVRVIRKVTAIYEDSRYPSGKVVAFVSRYEPTDPPDSFTGSGFSDFDVFVGNTESEVV